MCTHGVLHNWFSETGNHLSDEVDLESIHVLCACGISRGHRVSDIQLFEINQGFVKLLVGITVFSYTVLLGIVRAVHNSRVLCC